MRSRGPPWVNIWPDQGHPLRPLPLLPPPHSHTHSIAPPVCRRRLPNHGVWETKDQPATIVPAKFSSGFEFFD